ncbi:MAG: carboxypeptidase regulatory-like domain-containing protein [Prosthecobacter sp.]
MKILISALSAAALIGTAFAEPVPLRCVVVTADEKPVVGAEVFIIRPPNRLEILDQQLIATGKTDAQGRFSVEHEIPAGREFFYFSAIANAGAAGVGSVTIFHREGETPPSEARIRLMPVGEFKAKVTLPDGAPAGGIEFWVAFYGLPAPAGSRFPMFASAIRLPGSLWKATTDAAGGLVVPQVPKNAGIYLEHADKRYAQMYGMHNILLPKSPKADGAVHALALTTPGSIQGRVVLPDGTPAAGTLVSIIERMPYVTAFSGQVKAGEDGGFVIGQIPASTYHLHLETVAPFHEKWIGDDKKDIVVKAGEITALGELQVTSVAVVTAQVLNADSGEEIEKPIVVRFAAGVHDLHYRSHRMQPKGYHEPAHGEDLHVTVKAGEHKTVQFKLHPVKKEDMVRGTVVDEGGKPVAGASVLMMDGHWNAPPPTVSGEDGSFEVICRPDARRLALLAWDTHGAMSDPEVVKRGEVKTITLRTGGFARVTGQVVNESGQPVSGARISWHLPGIEYGSASSGPVASGLATDAEGRFVIPRIWAGLDHPVFFISAEGYGGAAFREEKLVAGKTTELNAKLLRADLRIAGLVVDKAGKPVPDIRVEAMGDGQSNRAHAVTDEAGRFTISGLSRGSATLNLWQQSTGQRDNQRAQVPDENIRLVWPDAAGALTGTVVDSEGRPFQGAKVESYASSSSAITDASGSFKLEKLRAGWCSVTITGTNDAGAAISHEVRLKSGMKNVRLQMPAKTREQEPLPVKTVNLIGTSAPEIQVATWLNSAPLPAKAGGKVRILDFWGMECGPCIAGFPKVQAFWAKHQDQGLEIIAHSSGFYPEQEVREFLARHANYKFPIALASEGGTAGRDYDVRGIPTYVVIDQKGKIVSSGHDWEEAAKTAENLLKK